MLSKQIPLGIYEKALPGGECWLERLQDVYKRQGLRCANVEICLSANGAGMVSGDVRYARRRTVVRADPE